MIFRQTMLPIESLLPDERVANVIEKLAERVKEGGHLGGWMMITVEGEEFNITMGPITYSIEISISKPLAEEINDG